MWPSAQPRVTLCLGDEPSSCDPQAAKNLRPPRGTHTRTPGRRPAFAWQAASRCRRPSPTPRTPKTTHAESCPSAPRWMHAPRLGVESSTNGRMVLASQSPTPARALVFPRNRRGPNLFPGALCVTNLSPSARRSAYAEVPLRGPRHVPPQRSECTPRTPRQKPVQQQQPARLLDLVFPQPQSSTASSPRSDSHDRPSSPSFLAAPPWIEDRHQRPPSTDPTHAFSARQEPA